MRLGWRPFVLALFVTLGFVAWTTLPDSLHWIRSEPSLSADPFLPASASASLTREELSNIDIYNQALPATVHITSTVLRRSWFDVYAQKGSGSGFIIDANGLILTNNHVIRGTAELEVTVGAEGSKSYKGEIVAADSANDLALIRIRADEELPVLSLGASDSLQVGQKVLAIGNPFGLDGTLTTGVISSLGRTIEGEDGVLEDLIQTDAAINPGNSGGPLLDSSGAVIGVNTAIFGREGNIGIGFAMPISRARPLLDYARSDGEKSPPEPMGLRSVFLPTRYASALELGDKPGLLITEVIRGSAAAEAGLRGADQEVRFGNTIVPYGGDLIVSVDGRPMRDKRVLSQVLSLKYGGDTVQLGIVRDGAEREVEVVLRARRGSFRF